MSNAVLKTYYRGDDEVEGEYELRRFKYSVDSDGVAVATWAKPDKLNPLTQETVWEMFVILEHAERDPAVRALVLTGEGRAFSSGASPVPDCEPCLEEAVMEGYKKRNKGTRAPVDIALKGLTMRFYEFPKFVISAVNGLAIGGGANIALLLADHVIVADCAQFRYPFTELGFTPEVSSALVLPQRIGMVRAKELLMLGRWFDAKEAHRLGLCNAVVEGPQVLPHALELAKSVAGMNQASVRLSKRIMHRPVLQILDDHMDAENKTFLEVFQSQETKASIKKFSQRHGGVASASKL